MIDTFHATTKKELDFVGTVGNGESLSFSALGTFDSSDSRDQVESGDRHTNNISQFSNPSVGHRDPNDASLLCQGRSRDPKTSTSPSLDISPLSSISTDDSFSESPKRANQLSIFRPKVDKDYGDSCYNANQSSFGHKMRNSTPSTVKGPGKSNNHLSAQEYYEHNFPTTRQVSVSENKSFKSRNTFDSLNDSDRMHNVVPVDSMTCKEKNGEPTSLDGAERLQDVGCGSERNEHSNYYENSNYQDRVMNISMRYQSNLKSRELNEKTVPQMSPSLKRDERHYSPIVTPRKHFKQKTINYLMILRPRANLFSEFMFLLPGLKMYVATYLANEKHEWSGYRRKYEDIIAKRRLICAVQAYGGNMPPRSNSMQQNNPSSIFRFKVEDIGSRGKYDQSLHTRYYENSSRLSWDVEENPPIHLVDEDNAAARRKHSKGSRTMTEGNASEEKAQKDDSKMLSVSSKNYADTKEEKESSSSSTPKMRYRCKLCGQPKQNHTCPYQQALQRNIGTMSYPALNAFQCKEIGLLTPALSDMNNFVDLENDDEYGDEGMQPDDCKSSGVPEIRNKLKRPIESISGTKELSNNSSQHIWSERRKVRVSDDEKAEKYEGDDKLYHETMDIKPEQYRLVSSRAINQMGDYRYPSLPLTFQQRKNASEELFELCQQISGLSEDCAEVLQVARESNSWDLAVAELLTQILVILHCPVGDDTLNGLCQYLEKMGISC